jgi:hypothetical protein
VDDSTFDDPEPDLDDVEPRPEVGVKWMWMRGFGAMVSKAPTRPGGPTPANALARRSAHSFTELCRTLDARAVHGRRR